MRGVQSLHIFANTFQIFHFSSNPSQLQNLFGPFLYSLSLCWFSHFVHESLPWFPFVFWPGPPWAECTEDSWFKVFVSKCRVWASSGTVPVFFSPCARCPTVLVFCVSVTFYCKLAFRAWPCGNSGSQSLSLRRVCCYHLRWCLFVQGLLWISFVESVFFSERVTAVSALLVQWPASDWTEIPSNAGRPPQSLQGGSACAAEPEGRPEVRAQALSGPSWASRFSGYTGTFPSPIPTYLPPQALLSGCSVCLCFNHPPTPRPGRQNTSAFKRFYRGGHSVFKEPPTGQNAQPQSSESKVCLAPSGTSELPKEQWPPSSQLSLSWGCRGH